jgi:hypothetical protein
VVSEKDCAARFSALLEDGVSRMSPTSKSAEKVQYDLRPAKQVERRMLVDALQRLTQVGFGIRDYQYTGLGSIYFFDFIVFHKLLGIHKMLSVEHDLGLEKRVKFNCPFKCVSVFPGKAKDAIPTLSRDLKHFLWLDYDNVVDVDELSEIQLAGRQLPVGSIVLVTVDTESPIANVSSTNDLKSYFDGVARNYLGNVKPDEYTMSNLHRVSKKVIVNAIKDGLEGRQVEFIPLFDFVYADGHRMLSVGGMIGTAEDKRKVGALDLDGAAYFRLTSEEPPYTISVPKLTVKERHMLDAAMPCASSWQPKEFRLEEEDINSYREIYRFLPSYAELLQ